MPFYKTKAFVFCLALFAALLVASAVVGRRADAQRGLPRRQPVVNLALNPDTQQRLKQALAWDFAFIPLYVLNISLFAYLAARLTGAPLRFTWLIISLIFVGGLVDVCENLTLLHVIKASPKDVWVTAARVLEIAKFVFPAIGILYAVGVVVWRLLLGRR